MPTGSKNRIHRQAINTPGHAHELTFSCYQRFAFLKAKRTCQWLADAIRSALVKHSFDLWAFVFMPEYVHLIVRPRQPDYAMSRSWPESSCPWPAGRFTFSKLKTLHG